jgi:AcrR family transcriptional regulator
MLETRVWNAAGSQHKVRQTRRGKQRTEGMLRMAADLFLKHGYDQTSVDEVIQRTGGSKSHIYREFGDKEGLFLAAVKCLCAEVRLPIETLDVPRLPFEVGLRPPSQALAGRHLALQRLVFAEASRFQRIGETWFAGGPDVSHGIFSRFFAQAMQAGQLRQAEPDLMARLYCDMLSGHNLYRVRLGIREKPLPAVPSARSTPRSTCFTMGMQRSGASRSEQP